MYFETKLYKLLSEEDVLDRKIKYKDDDGNEKEATVGGILKKGADHPAHDLAQAEYDKDQGEGGEEPKKPAPKIDANPFDDEKPDDKPAAEKQPQAGPDLGEKEIQAFQQASQDPEWVEKYNKKLKNSFEHAAEELKDDPEYANYLKNSEEQQRTDALPGWNDKKKGFLKKKNWSSQIAADIAAKQAVLRGDSKPSFLPDPTAEPSSGSDTSKTYSSPEKGIEQNAEEIADLFNQRIENPEDSVVAKEMDTILMNIFQDDKLVTAITEVPPEDYKNAQRFIDNLKDTADEIGESKQPFREHYNRLFKGRDIL